MGAEIVLCSGNEGKLAELRAMLPAGLRVLGLRDVGLPTDLPETGDTLHANAEQKARFAFERCRLPCLADDSGLFVDALDGAPGVHSARYAGDAKSADANIRLLLRSMHGIADRRAHFRTVIAHVDAGGTHFFEGEVHGTITEAPRGTGGFGYDPVFLPAMSELTFAELDAVRKNAISHRAQAMWRLMRWLDGHHLVR